MNLLRYVRPGDDYVPTFPVFQKLEVNGANEHAMYTHLKSYCPTVQTRIGERSSMFWDPVSVNDITWNFQKFLIDAEGVPYKRFDPPTLPAQLRDDIDMLIKMRDSNMATSPPKVETSNESTSGATSSKSFW